MGDTTLTDPGAYNSNQTHDKTERYFAPDETLGMHQSATTPFTHLDSHSLILDSDDPHILFSLLKVFVDRLDLAMNTVYDLLCQEYKLKSFKLHHTDIASFPYNVLQNTEAFASLKKDFSNSEEYLPWVQGKTQKKSSAIDIANTEDIIHNLPAIDITEHDGKKNIETRFGSLPFILSFQTMWANVINQNLAFFRTRFFDTETDKTKALLEEKGAEAIQETIYQYVADLAKDAEGKLDEEWPDDVKKAVEITKSYLQNGTTSFS